jgi:hypothetical protein
MVHCHESDVDCTKNVAVVAVLYEIGKGDNSDSNMFQHIAQNLKYVEFASMMIL